jgi:predicted Zn-dependent protease
VLEHAWGLYSARQKRTEESVKALRAAALQEPDNFHFAYVYAVAPNDFGQPKEAPKVLDRALKRDPHDRDVLSGLAYFTAKEGNRGLALGYAKQLRGLDPENAEYVRMVDTMEKSPRR